MGSVKIAVIDLTSTKYGDRKTIDTLMKAWYVDGHDVARFRVSGWKNIAHKMPDDPRTLADEHWDRVVFADSNLAAVKDDREKYLDLAHEVSHRLVVCVLANPQVAPDDTRELVRVASTVATLDVVEDFVWPRETTATYVQFNPPYERQDRLRGRQVRLRQGGWTLLTGLIRKDKGQRALARELRTSTLVAGQNIFGSARQLAEDALEAGGQWIDPPASSTLSDEWRVLRGPRNILWYLGPYRHASELPWETVGVAAFGTSLRWRARGLEYTMLEAMDAGVPIVVPRQSAFAGGYDRFFDYSIFPFDYVEPGNFDADELNRQVERADQANGEIVFATHSSIFSMHDPLTNARRVIGA